MAYYGNNKSDAVKDINVMGNEFDNPTESLDSIKSYIQSQNNSKKAPKSSRYSKESVQSSQEILELLKKQNALNQVSNKRLESVVSQLVANNKMSQEDADAQLAELKQVNKENKSAAFKKIVSDGFSQLKGILNRLDTQIRTYTSFSISSNANLVGTGKSYKDLVTNINNAVGGTGLVQVSDVLSNMSSLLENGIVDNIEQRAFLNTIKDGISSTFDAGNGTMMQIIHLQEEDSTVNRLVMQASVKGYLNSNYENSQYIKESFDSVTNALVEMSSLVSSNTSLGVESTLQKWLGSLESSGMSSNTVSSLATAFGYLGSGDINNLSNSSLQNLLIMGASKSGDDLDYSSLLTGGLTESTTNSLMSGIVSYLSSLSGNNVVLSEYADLFGLNVSDLKAAQNVASSGVNVSGTAIDSSQKGLGKYLANYNSYLNAAPALLYDNLYNNMLFGLGQNVANDRTSYGIYKAGGIIGDTISSLDLNGITGTVANLIGPAMQLTAVSGLTSSGLTGVVDTITNLSNSFLNLFASPDAEKAFAALSNGSYSGGWTGTVGASRSGGTENAYERSTTNTISVTDDLAELETSRDANDIFEFLSDDVVTVTPADTGNEILATLSSYSKTTAESTARIREILEKFISGELAIGTSNIPIANTSTSIF